MSSGALKHAAVRFLASIVDRHCSAFGISSPEGRESVAASALAHYQRGVTAEQQLLEILALGRPSVGLIAAAGEGWRSGLFATLIEHEKPPSRARFSRGLVGLTPRPSGATFRLGA